jgi:uncharacterized protein YceK
MKIKNQVLTLYLIGLTIIVTGCGSTTNSTIPKQSTTSDTTALQMIANKKMKNTTDKKTSQKSVSSSSIHASLGALSETKKVNGIVYSGSGACNKKNIQIIENIQFYAKEYTNSNDRYIEYFEDTACKTIKYTEFIYDNNATTHTEKIQDKNGKIIHESSTIKNSITKTETTTEKGVFSTNVWKINSQTTLIAYYKETSFAFNTLEKFSLTGKIIVNYLDTNAQINLNNIDFQMNMNLDQASVPVTIERQSLPLTISVPFNDGNRTFTGNFEFTVDTSPPVSTVTTLQEDNKENFWANLYDEAGTKVSLLIVRFDDNDQLEFRMYCEHVEEKTKNTIGCTLGKELSNLISAQ